MPRRRLQAPSTPEAPSLPPAAPPTQTPLRELVASSAVQVPLQFTTNNPLDQGSVDHAQGVELADTIRSHLYSLSTTALGAGGWVNLTRALEAEPEAPPGSRAKEVTEPYVSVTAIVTVAVNQGEQAYRAEVAAFENHQISQAEVGVTPAEIAQVFDAAAYALRNLSIIEEQLILNAGLALGKTLNSCSASDGSRPPPSSLNVW